MISTIFRNSKRRLTFWQKEGQSMLLAVSLLILLAACSANNVQSPALASPTASMKIHAAPTTLPSGTLLYQADWAHRLTDWHPSPGWKFADGVLQTDPGTDEVLTAPYKPTVADYAVEVRFRIVSIPRNGGYFVLAADKIAGKDGYVAGIINFLAPGPRSIFANPSIQVYIDPFSDMDGNMVISDYKTNANWHTYRIEVQGAGVEFFMDGSRRSAAVSSQTAQLSNGPLRLKATGAVLYVQSFRVMTL
jgi:hypothetical protein